MATKFDVVYDSFLSKISDFDWLEMREDDLKDCLFDLLKQAISRFGKDCKVDLFSHDEVEFADNLTPVEIDILSEIMIENWLKPKLYNSELLRNRLSTKDFSQFSPANLLKSIRETYELSHRRSETEINRYTFTENDVRNLKHD